MGGFTDIDVSDQSGRTILVTGANTGLGFGAAKVLAAQGARVLLGCRSLDKANAAIDAIRVDVSDADLDVIQIDQADLSSVRDAAAQVNEEARLDVLVNNAGIMMPPREMTADGFESQFGVNHLGTFALTSLLLPKLGEQPDARVVVTSSIAHRGAKIFFDDINAQSRYRAQDRYGQSKLANLMFAFELDRRLRRARSSTIAVGCHPGIADTELARHLPLLVRFAVPLFRPFFNSAAEGAWPTLMAATAPGVEGGEYFGPTRRNETAGPAGRARASSVSRDGALAAELWELSIEMTGIDPALPGNDMSGDQN
jgi:NAD(P)-dependent dehydrogenase (short-subunit alcohol dehydrogenase family)